jgi:hypothetical protein
MVKTSFWFKWVLGLMFRVKVGFGSKQVQVKVDFKSKQVSGQNGFLVKTCLGFKVGFKFVSDTFLHPN